ncbi:hypothetical protein RJ641_017114 [Dillenia turbinata]|uniref:Uncharacterized protein n=1 Tax=Dillenia turbinata TaxID=194707 RepID=A0AAN8YZG1_9MAGN
MSSPILSGAKILQSLPINLKEGGSASDPPRPLLDPLLLLKSKSSLFRSSSKLRHFSSHSSRLSFSSSASSSSAVFAVSSDVVKEEKKKPKPSTSVSDLLISKEEGLELYEDMVLGRAFEDVRSNVLQRQDVRICASLQRPGGRLHRIHQSPEEGGLRGQHLPRRCPRP